MIDWYIEVFGEPILTVLLGVAGIALSVLAALMSFVLGGLLVLYFRVGLWKVKIIRKKPPIFRLE